MHILFVLLHLLGTVTASYGRINENNLGQVNNNVNKNNTNSLPNLYPTFAFESVPSVSIMNTVQQQENDNLSCSSSKTPSTLKITSDNDKIADDDSSYQPPVRIGKYREHNQNLFCELQHCILSERLKREKYSNDLSDDSSNKTSKRSSLSEIDSEYPMMFEMEMF